MFSTPENKSWFSRINLFGRRAERTPSQRTPVSRSSFRPSLEKLEDRLVLSPTLITNTTVFPASAVVEIYSTFPNGQVEQGTGTMVSPNTVLTAGHVVYNASEGGWAKSLEVIPGRSGNKQPYGIAWGTSEQTFNSYIADSKANSNSHQPGDGDVGFISLNKDIGYSTGWLGFMATSGYNYNVNKYGYPGTNGYNGSQMYYDFGKLNTLGAGTVSGFSYWGWSTSAMSAIPGQSGSSLILSINGKMGIIGVQDVGNPSEGYAEVTTSTVVNALSAFERAHPAVASNVASTHLASQPTVNGVATTFDLAVNPTAAPAASILGNDIGSGATQPTPANPSSPLPAHAASPVVASQASQNTASTAPSAMQLFLDGITLAMDLSSPGGLSTVLADSALMHDIDAAGGIFNPYLDAGLLTALSALDSSHNS